MYITFKVSLEWDGTQLQPRYEVNGKVKIWNELPAGYELVGFFPDAHSTAAAKEAAAEGHFNKLGPNDRLGIFRYPV